MISGKCELGMGGIGSGNRFRAGKATTSNLRQLDVRYLKRAGALVPGCYADMQWGADKEITASIRVRMITDHVMLSCQTRTREGKYKEMVYPVYLEWTPCNRGGQRVWFRCPAVGCGRRVAILYGGAVYACRHCHNLAYESQREEKQDRAYRRVEKLRKRLGWRPGIAKGHEGKPKGMQWHTYRRLWYRHIEEEEFILAGIWRWLGLER